MAVRSSSSRSYEPHAPWLQAHQGVGRRSRQHPSTLAPDPSPGCGAVVPDPRAADRDLVRCVTGPVNKASIAFHRRLGFGVEAEVADYDGAGQARVLLSKRL